jgi:Zn-finger nucleic acid-binding protein
VAYRESFESCPRCGVALEDAGDVRACNACRGQWVLEPVLAEMVMAMLPAGVLGRLTLVPIAQRTEPTACPSCGVQLESVIMCGVEIERCPKDHGVWFDPEELQTGLLRSAANPARSDPMPHASEQVAQAPAPPLAPKDGEISRRLSIPTMEKAPGPRMSSLTLSALLAEPSRANLRRLCEELDGVESAALAELLPSVIEHLARWPDDDRHGRVYRIDSRWSQDYKAKAEADDGPVARWLWELFDGVADPRLAVLRSASLYCEIEPVLDPWDGKDWSGEALVRAFGRFLDPEFAYPDTNRGSASDRDPNGEQTLTRYGDEQRGLCHSSYTIEHAADSTCGDRYQLYGLAAANQVALDVSRRSSVTYKLDISGSAPAVFDVALVWGELLRAGPALLATESIGAIAARLRSSA